MASRIPNFVSVCIILLVARDSAAKTLAKRCDYGCKVQDSDANGDYFASGSAISSQFVMPDGSVITNSKGSSYDSAGIRETFHELKKEADKFVQTGHGGPAIHSHHLPQFGNIQNFAAAPIPQLSVPVPFYSSGHESYSQSSKDQQLANQAVYSHTGQAQAIQNEHAHSSSHVSCEVCALNAGGSKSENTASYQTIVGNVAPVNEVHSSQQKYESSSAQKNSTYYAQPIVPFSNNVKPNTFTANFVDLNPPYIRHLANGAGTGTQVNYEEQGSSHIKTEERVSSQPTYGGGPVAHLSNVVVGVGGPSAVNMHAYEKQQQSSSFVQTADHPAVFPAASLAQQAEEELSKQRQSNVFRSPVLLGGVPQPVPIEQHGGSYQSSHTYFSSSSSSSSKQVGSNDQVVIPQKLSASNGYSSSGSSKSSSSYSQSAPEVYYNGNQIHGVSSSIYNQQRGDQIGVNSNAETLCNPCTYVAGAPVKKTYGVATSYSSQSSTINGKTTENREAAVAVNDNGKIDQYHVKT